MATAFFNTKIETSNSKGAANRYDLDVIISKDSKIEEFKYNIIQSPSDVSIVGTILSVGFESNGTLIIQVSGDKFLANATTEIQISFGRRASSLKESQSFVNGVQYTKDNWISIISNPQDKEDTKIVE